MASSKRFRHAAGFGKRIEYWIVGRMLKDGLDVYVPLVDDQAVDAIVRRPDGSTALVQIKARSADVAPGDAALFAGIPHPRVRDDYWFVFYAERIERMWILTSREFVRQAYRNKSGKNAGKYSIWFNGKRRDRQTGNLEEAVYPRFIPFLAMDFRRIRDGVRHTATGRSSSARSSTRRTNAVGRVRSPRAEASAASASARRRGR
jgi:hypothetical protein